MLLAISAVWLSSAFFSLTLRHDKAGSVVLRGGAFEVWTLTEQAERSQSREQYEREPPWTIRWAWPFDRGHFVDTSMPEFRNGESVGWHPPRSPELLLRPYLTRSTSSWFMRAPLWLAVLPLTLLVVGLRIRDVRSPYVPTCERCGYCLSGITENPDSRIVCPECGKEQAQSA